MENLVQKPEDKNAKIFKYNKANLQQKTNFNKKLNLENILSNFTFNALLNNHHDQTFRFKPKSFTISNKLKINPKLKFGISGNLPYTNIASCEPQYHLNFYDIFDSKQNLKASSYFKNYEFDRLELKTVYEPATKKKSDKKETFSFEEHDIEENELRDKAKQENQESTHNILNSKQNFSCNIIYKPGVVFLYPTIRTKFNFEKWNVNASANPKAKMQGSEIFFYKHYYKVVATKDFLKKKLSAKVDLLISSQQDKKSFSKKNTEADNSSTSAKNTDTDNLFENAFNEADVTAKIAGPLKYSSTLNLNYSLVKIPKVGNLGINFIYKQNFDRNKRIYEQISFNNFTSKLKISKNSIFGNAYMKFPSVRKLDIEELKNTKIYLNGNKSLNKYGKLNWNVELGKKSKFSVCYTLNKISGFDGKLCINDIKLN